MARKTRADLKSAVSTQIVPNLMSAITPVVDAAIRQDTLDSIFVLDTDTADALTDGTTKVLMTSTERTKLSGLPDYEGLVGMIGEGGPVVPTKVSDLTNDSGFQTASDVSTYVTGLGYITSESLPTNVSDLTNDSGFQTASDVSTYVTGLGYQTASDVSTYVTGLGYITSSSLPTAVSELSNDSGFQTSSDVSTYVTGLGYQTSTDVTTTITSYAYTNADDVSSIVLGYGFLTFSESASQIEDYNYCTLLDVAGEGYFKSDDVSSAISSALADYTPTSGLSAAIQDWIDANGVEP